MARRPGNLRIRIGDGPISNVVIGSSRRIKFGRSSRVSDVVIAHDSVSKIHFSLRATDGGVELEDLGSKNGTWFAERRIRRMTLLPGDRFWAGQVAMQLIAQDQVDVEVASDSEWGLLQGESVAMRELFAALTRVTLASVDLVIQGGSGTGKQLAARSIHARSSRSAGPFVTLDCASLPSMIADATLLGFGRGAFAGADTDQAGVFEQADSGVLLLDNIDRLAPEPQATILRALDTAGTSRLGDLELVREFDVRVVAVSRRDLAAEVEAGRFSAELHRRLARATVRLPELRERDGDLFMLAERLLLALCEGKEATIVLADDAKLSMAAHDWPGNVRELDHTIRRAARMCKDKVIRAEDLEFGDAWGDKLPAEFDAMPNYEAVHDAVDRLYLPHMLAECGSISATARRLGITRERLRAKLRTMGLLG